MTEVTLRIRGDATGVQRASAEASQAVGRLRDEQGRFVRASEQAGAAGQRSGQQIAAGAAQAETVLQRVNGALREQWAELTDVKNVTLAATAAFTAFIGASSVFAAEYEKSIAQVSTLLSDTSGIDALSESVRALNREFGGGAALQAAGLADIIGTGFEDAAQAVEILRDANRLAVGGITDVKTAADGLTTAMKAFGDSVGNSGAVSDAFFTAALAGKTTIEQLSASIGAVAPIAAQTGVSLNEVLAATATLTRGGVATSTAMDGIRAAIATIIGPSEQAKKLAEQLGLQFNAAALQSKGLSGVLADVAEKTGGSAEKMNVLFGGVEALLPVLTLTGNGAQGFARDLEAMETAAGATEGAVAKMTDTASFQFGRLKAAGEDILIGVGQALNEGVGPALKFIADALPVFAASWADTFGQASEVVNQLTSDGNSLAGMYRNYVESVLGATGEVVARIVEGFVVLPQTLGAVFTAIIAAGDLAWISLKTGAERLSLDMQSLWVAIKAAGVRAFGELAIEAAGQLDRLLRGVRENATAIGAALSSISPAAGAAFRAASAELDQYGGLQEQVRQGVANTSAELANQAAELAKLTQQSFDNRASLIAGSRAALDAAVAEQQAAVKRIGALREANAAVAAGAAVSRQAAAATDVNTAATQANAEALRAQAAAAGQAGVGLAGAAACVGAFAGATASATSSQTGLSDASQQAAEDSARYWAGAGDAIAGAFGDFVASGLKSFSDFGSSLKRIAQQIISDLVAQFAKQRIVIPIMASIGFNPDALAGKEGASLLSSNGFLSSLFRGASESQPGFVGPPSPGAFPIPPWASTMMSTLAAATAVFAGGSAISRMLGGEGSIGGLFGGLVGGLVGQRSYRPTGAGGASFNFGTDAATGNAFTEESRRRSLFRGTRYRNVESALGSDIQQQIDALFESVGVAMSQAARQLGVDIPPRITASFRATTDASGNVISEVGTILGRQYNESFEVFSRRIAAENVIGVLDAALDGEAGRIAEAWRGSADTLADGAQFLLTAATDLRGGFDLLGDASLTGVAELVQRLAGDGESLTAAYQRVAGATRLLDEAVSLSGVTLDMTREQFVTFAAGIAEAAGGLEAAQGLFQRYFATFYTEQERGLVQLQQATARAQSLAGGLGLDLGSFTGQGGAQAFRELFESQLPTLSAEATVQWLQFADALGIVLDLQGRYTEAVLQTADTLGEFMAGIGSALAEFAPAQTLQQQLDAQRAANDEMLARAIELGASETQLAQVRQLADRRIGAIIDSVSDQTATLTGALRRLGISATGTAQEIAVAASGLSSDFNSLFDEFLGTFFSDAERGAFEAAQAQQALTQALQAAGLATDELISREQLRAQIETALAAGNYALAESLLRVASAMNRVEGSATAAATAINNGNGNMFGLGGGSGQLGFGVGVGGPGDAGQQLVNTIEDIRQGLRDWLTSLTTGDLSPERPREQLRIARAELARLVALAQGGDLEAMRQLSAAGDTVLRLGQQVFRGAGYRALFDEVRALVGGVAGVGSPIGGGPGGGGRPGDDLGDLGRSAQGAALALDMLAARAGMPPGSLSVPSPQFGGVSYQQAADVSSRPVVQELQRGRAESAQENARLRAEIAELSARMDRMSAAAERSAQELARANDYRRV